jgi:hypothetical protein
MHQQTSPLPPSSEKKPSSRRIIVSVSVIVIIVSVILASVFLFASQLPKTAAQPDIGIVSVIGNDYLSGLTYRIKVTATLSNLGDANGYATVNYYYIIFALKPEDYDLNGWPPSNVPLPPESRQVQQLTQHTVFVPAHSSVTDSADMPVIGIPTGVTVTYDAQVIQQTRA